MGYIMSTSLPFQSGSTICNPSRDYRLNRGRKLRKKKGGDYETTMTKRNNVPSGYASYGFPPNKSSTLIPSSQYKYISEKRTLDDVNNKNYGVLYKTTGGAKKTVKRKTTKRKTPKRKTVKRKTPKRKTTKRKKAK